MSDKQLRKNIAQYNNKYEFGKQIFILFYFHYQCYISTIRSNQSSSPLLPRVHVALFSLMGTCLGDGMAEFLQFFTTFWKYYFSGLVECGGITMISSAFFILKHFDDKLIRRDNFWTQSWVNYFHLLHSITPDFHSLHSIAPGCVEDRIFAHYAHAYLLQYFYYLIPLTLDRSFIIV